MIEIDKLRKRLRNVHKNATEYRMTVTEAHRLLAEIDDIMAEKEKVVVEEILQNVEPLPAIRILDGGTF